MQALKDAGVVLALVILALSVRITPLEPAEGVDAPETALLAPPVIRDYVLIHELMHLRRLDHSPAYWRLVAACCPGYQDARRWLRTHGRQLG